MHNPSTHTPDGTPIEVAYLLSNRPYVPYIPYAPVPVESAEARALREERQAAEARAREEQAVRDHTAAVATYRAVSGWDPRRVAELDGLIASERGLREPNTLSLAIAVAVSLFSFFWLAVTVLVAASSHRSFSSDDVQSTLFCLGTPAAVGLIFAVALLPARADWKRRQRWLVEREQLRVAAGCGVANCSRCRKSA